VGEPDQIPQPPSGFVRSEGRGSFSSHNGPYFHRLQAEDLTEQAFYALPRHANGLGLVHGGMLTSFLDGLLAGAVFRGTGQRAVTMHLSVDFLHMARIGEWVMGEASLTRATRDVAFVEGKALVRGVEVARATGVFKLMHSRG
jgi:uncharacterized protein (TIGR00369 family)